MNRIFISYRSSDGKKDADRLCADLSRLYGDDKVFFDKQDLRGGTSWRGTIGSALDAQPVVLLLITPELMGMAHPDGGRRIDREDDPIRNELLAARQAHATVIPLLTEGMQMPPVASVPEPLRFITESHALKLRTDDWPADLQRVVDDLGAHGIHPVQPTPSPSPQAPGPAAHPVVRRLQKGLMIFGGIMAALLAIGLMWPEEPAPIATDEADRPPLQAAATGESEAAAPAAEAPEATAPPDTAGVWWSINNEQRRLRVQFTVNADAIELQTDAFPVSWYPHWVAYARSVRDMGLVVTDVRYVGRGVLTHVMGVPRIEMPVQAFTADGRGPLDTGSVVLSASADGRELTGELWSNGEQAATPLRLVRRP